MTIEFATEIPTAHLDAIHPLVDWHFVIATECLKDRDYFEWYKNRPRDAKIMLDNGMFEEGKPLEPDVLLDIAHVLKPEVVFAPDQVGQALATIEMTHEFIRLTQSTGGQWKVGVIPQGNSPQDIVTCHYLMCNTLDFDGPIGISFLNDRNAVIELMDEQNAWDPERWYHFLGLYSLDEINTWPKYVRSMDTIKPFKAAMHGYRVQDCPRGLGKWNTKMIMPKEKEGLMLSNYAEILSALRGR